MREERMLTLYRQRVLLLSGEPGGNRELLLAQNGRRLLELRYNERHDPESGRFTSGPGSSRIGKTRYAP